MTQLCASSRVGFKGPIGGWHFGVVSEVLDADRYRIDWDDGYVDDGPPYLREELVPCEEVPADER